jgi:glucose-fructose oxidoreductase
MASDSLRFALVGLGFGRLVMDDYRNAPGAELGLLCDIDGAKAAELSRESGVPFTTRFEDCLGPEVDVVDISTPNHLHAGQAVAALQAGKHVFLQKPMAPTTDDCRTILEAGARTGRQVGMFMSSLNDPTVQELRAMIAAGAFGRVISLRGRNAHRSAHTKWKEWERPADYWRRRKDLVGGGCMALIGIHGIHLLQWLAAAAVESAAAVAENVASREIMEGEDACAAACRLESGAVAVLEASYASEGGSTEIFGTEGWAILREGTLRLKLDRPWKGRLLEVPGDGVETVIEARELKRLGAPLLAEFEQHGAFARAVLAGEAPPVPGTDGLRDVAVLEAIYRSAAGGRRERVRQPGRLL